MAQLYAIALGSNRRHGRYGAPEVVVRAALRAIEQAGMRVLAASPILRSVAIGPAGRSFANAAAIVASALAPPAMLIAMKRIERDFGRRAGRRWGPRVLDLDLVLWSEGRWPPAPRGRPRATLSIPHRSLAERDFVLRPLVRIATAWPDPRLIRRLDARLTARRPLPRERVGSGR